MNETDRNTLKSARHLIESAKGGLPKGETAETVGEFVQAHRVALGKMKQQPGKGVVVMALDDLAKRYPYVRLRESDPVELASERGELL